ncbi:MAG: hypothetical protein ACFB0D_10835 [Phormidesmis sp.]
MKNNANKNQLSWLGQYALISLSVVGMAAGGCTMTEPTADAPSETVENPSVRLPSIRLSRRAVVPIDSLMAERESDKVAVSGTVTQRAAILNGWLYKVEDDTGSLWVQTEQSEPEVGAIATVEGTVRYESIVVGEIDAGSVYLEEQAYEQQTVED